MKSYELFPNDGHKSFYGKARVFVDGNGAETLRSYETNVLYRDENGNLFRMWDGWSATTGRHIRAFCGLNKAEYLQLPVLPGTCNGILSPDESLRRMFARRRVNLSA